jgi:hypothetical protein
LGGLALFIPGSFELRYPKAGGVGVPASEAAMKIPPFVAVTAVVLLATGSVLAVMNNSCKTSQHRWCAPSTAFHHQTVGRH